MGNPKWKYSLFVHSLVCAQANLHGSLPEQTHVID